MPPTTTVSFPRPFEPERLGEHWFVERDGIEVKLSNLPKVLWPQKGYTKGDMLACYDNLAPYLLPYLRDRPLTLRRMPDGIEGNEFYEKQAPSHTPDWVPRAFIEGHGSRGHIDFLMAQDTASLLYVVNLGCIEMHPMHARQASFDRPDYLFFDLDPFPPIEFSTVRKVASIVGEALERLGLTSVPKISGATGIVIYSPLDGRYGYEAVRTVVERICRIVHRAFPEATTMAPRIADRAGKVFLDHAMVSEGRNIASIYSMRPTPEATIGMPVTWDELRTTDVVPTDFTIESVWERLGEVGDLFEPMRVAGTPGGHDLGPVLEALGIDPARFEPPRDDSPAQPGSLGEYQRKRDFAKTSEPAGGTEPAPLAGDHFMIHKHNARRLHYDLRLSRGGVLVSWAIPKGIPDEPNIRHLAVHVEDHPIEYANFEGTIPEGEYGAGESRIFDEGTYEVLEWIEDKKATVRLRGARVSGEYHLVRTRGNQWLIFRSARDAPAPVLASPPALEPMLASGGGEPFDDPDWSFEVKWDGVRTLAAIEAESVKLHSRRGRDVTEVYPELSNLASLLVGKNALLDGEIVVLGDSGVPSFERIQRRFTTDRPSKRDVARDPVQFLVFDILWFDGEATVERTYAERRDLLERVLVQADGVQLSQRFPGERGKALFEAVSARGMEGLIAKRLDSIYLPGRRTKDWIKIKVRRTLDAAVIGWTQTAGSREASVGSLLVAIPDEHGSLRFAGHVGTGFTQRTAQALARALEPHRIGKPAVAIPSDAPIDEDTRWVAPSLVIAVEYLELTSQHRLRAASFKGILADRSVEDLESEI
ncbi:MAG: non-homologous end-joining DNA ligase [Actinomycetota bacterium]